MSAQGDKELKSEWTWPYLWNTWRKVDLPESSSCHSNCKHVIAVKFQWTAVEKDNGAIRWPQSHLGAVDWHYTSSPFPHRHQKNNLLSRHRHIQPYLSMRRSMLQELRARETHGERRIQLMIRGTLDLVSNHCRFRKFLILFPVGHTHVDQTCEG